MPIRLFCLCAVLAFIAMPALAGTVTVGDGKIVWTSTQCTAPAPPPSFSNNPETPANDVNARVTDYNNYTQAAQAYMKCMSAEAQKDATATSHAVVASAQGAIAEEQKKVAALDASWQSKQPRPGK